jgi:hypothetical protein
MRIVTTAAVALGIAAVAGCDMGALTVNTTTKVLVRAQPALKMESDFELAAQAVPGTLKTVEGFWNVSPNEELTRILTEGYCQYGSVFVEDEWERAVFAKQLDRIEELNEHSTKVFNRCLNYALRQLGPAWQKDLFGTTEAAQALIAKVGPGKRDAMMWAAIAMGSIINHNLDDIEIIAYLPTVKLMFARVLELDARTKPRRGKDGTIDCSGMAADRCVYRALPHVAMGMLLSATGKDTGGDPALATKHFDTAVELTGGRMLLPSVLKGYRVGAITGDRKLFRDVLLDVMAKDPALWPEQRLANEFAKRRARRYLKLEKEIF